MTLRQIRLLVVYSSWVQALTADAPLSYIQSLFGGSDYIEGSMEICQSPWFDLLSLAGLERILLYAFESVTLSDKKRTSEIFSKVRQTPQTRPLKRGMDYEPGSMAKRHKVEGREKTVP